MSLSDHSHLAPDLVHRVTARFLRDAVQEILAAFSMDMFARLSLLEGAAGVSPGTWLRRGARGFGSALEHFGPGLAPQWTSNRNEGVYDKALSVAERTLSGSGLDAPDLIQDMTINSTRSGGHDRTRLFYTVGSKLRSFEHDLGEGKITPRDGKVLGTLDRWVTRAAITELKSWRSRKVRHFAPGTEEGFDPTRVRPAPGLTSEAREKLILLALQSPGGPGNEIRRIVDHQIDQYFPPSARSIVRVFLQKVAEPKYRSPSQMRQIVKRFTPERWFSQAMTVIRTEMMRELGVSSQQLTNALGGKASKVFRFMRDRVGKDPRVQKILIQLADDIDLLEPGVTRLGKERRYQLTEEQTPEMPHRVMVEWLGDDEDDEGRDASLPSQHGRPDHWLDLYESGEYMDWSSLVGPHGVFNRGPVPLRVAQRFLRAKVEKTLSVEETKKYLATPPDERIQDRIRDENGNTFSINVQVKGDPTIRKSRIEDHAQVSNAAQVEDSTIGGHAVVEGDAKVTNSEISGDARVRGSTEIRNAKIEGGSWESQTIADGHGGTFHDAYEQDVLDILTGIEGTSPGPGDSPIQAMARYFADGGRTKGWFGMSGQLDRHSLQEKIQKHIYEDYDKKDPVLGRGAAALEKLDDEGFKKLLEVAKNKGAHLKDERKKKEASDRNRRLTYALTEAAFLRPELREDLLPLVQLAHTSRVAAASMDLRGVVVRLAFATKKAELRTVIVGTLKQADALDKTALRQKKKRYRQPFLRWIKNRKFPHPDPARSRQREVSFFTLPSEEQSRIYQEWQKNYRDWARQHMPEGLSEGTRITSDNFDDVEIGDVLWYSASPGKLLRVTGINREGWRARQPTLELVQIDLSHPDWEGEERNINKSTLRNEFLEVHRVPGHGPGAKRERERLRQQESEKKRREHRERVKADLPREPKGGWPDFDDVGLSEKKRKRLQEAFKGMAEIKDPADIGLSRIRSRIQDALDEEPSRKVVKEFMHNLGEWADQLADAAKRGGKDFEPQQRLYGALRAKIDQGIRRLDGEDRDDRRSKREEKKKEQEKERETARSKRIEKHKDRKKLRGGGQKKLEDDAQLTSWFISQVLPENVSKAVRDRAREQLKKAKYGDLEGLLAAADHIVENPDSDFAKQHALMKHLGYDRDGLVRLRKLLRRKLKDVHGRTYHPDVLRIANKYGLEIEDADALYDWRADKPPRGRPLSDQEKFNRFVAKAKPETRERMQGMNLADFMIMYKAILQEVLEDEEEAAA